jgi:hypothetical protein
MTRLESRRTENQVGRCFAPQGNFRAIHAEHAGIAEGRTASGLNQRPGQKAKLHQAPGVVFGKVNVIEHSLFPVPQAVQAPRSVPVTGRAAAFFVFDTELQIAFSMERPSVDCQGLVLDERAKPSRYAKNAPGHWLLSIRRY